MLPKLISITIAALIFTVGCQAKKPPSALNDCDTAFGDAQITEIETSLEQLTRGITSNPTQTILPEDTNGTLSLGLNADIFPILSSPTGVHSAASKLEKGRIVAYSGQDFLGSQDRSTLLGELSIDTLISNAVYWSTQTDSSAPPKVLVANDRIKEVLQQNGISDVTVSPVILTDGLWSFQDWSADALSEMDAAVVQVNEWGTLYVNPEDVNALRDFVASGGGLLIAGSALHYSWWLDYSAEQFIGDMLTEGTGISWNILSIKDLSNSTVVQDALSTPYPLWCTYLAGEPMTENQLVQLPPLFNAAKNLGKEEDLNAALERMINETPPLPVEANHPNARLSAEVATTLQPHQWPTVHPWTATFPGLPESVASVSDQTSTVDTTYSGAQPLAFYAPPGSIVTISVPESAVSQNLSIRVGELYDDLRYLEHIETWERAPMLVRDFMITTTQTEVINAYGGSISVLVPAGQSGKLDVDVSGAIPMANHVQGETTIQQWQTALQSGAPQAILQERGHIRMVVERSAAERVTSPDDVVSFWSEFHQHHAELAQEPSARLFESHWIFDVQVGWGYANATGDRITYPKLSEVWALRTETGNEDWWLFGHELGHQFQTANWTGGDITEVAVNLFTMYTLNDYIFNGTAYETIGFQDNTIDHEMLQNYRWDTADLFGKLQLYRQLIFEFGWGAFQETFASYYSDEYPVAQYGEFMDGFAIRLSAIVERDLSPFFLHWAYPVSQEAVENIQQFGHEAWLPPGW